MNNLTPAPDPRQPEIELSPLEDIFLGSIAKNPLPLWLVKHLRPESRAAFNMLDEFNFIELQFGRQYSVTDLGLKVLAASRG